MKLETILEVHYYRPEHVVSYALARNMREICLGILQLQLVVEGTVIANKQYVQRRRSTD